MGEIISAVVGGFVAAIIDNQHKKVKEAKKQFLQEKFDTAHKRQEDRFAKLKLHTTKIDEQGSFEAFTDDKRKVYSDRTIDTDKGRIREIKQWDERGNCIRDNNTYYTYYTDSNKVEFSCNIKPSGKKEIKHFNQNGKEDTKQYIELNWLKHRIAQKHIAQEEKIEKETGKKLPVMTKGEKIKAIIKERTGYNQ